MSNETQLSSFSVYWVLLAGLAHVVSLHIFSRALHHDTLKLCHKFLISEIYICRLFIYHHHQSFVGVFPKTSQPASSFFFILIFWNPSCFANFFQLSSNSPLFIQSNPSFHWSYTFVILFLISCPLISVSLSLCLCLILLFVLFYSRVGSFPRVTAVRLWFPPLELNQGLNFKA